MGEFDQLCREVILDHYKSPRHHGVLEDADAHAEGQNPLCGDELFALEDRCSHDDGPLCEGDWDPDECLVVCPRHGSRFDLRTGRPLSLPAYEPVATFPVRVEDGVVKIDV